MKQCFMGCKREIWKKERKRDRERERKRERKRETETERERGGARVTVVQGFSLSEVISQEQHKVGFLFLLLLYFLFLPM